MCGIIAVLRKKETREVPKPDDIDGLLRRAFTGDLANMAETLEEVDRALQGVPGVRFLLAHPEIAARLNGVDIDAAGAYISEREVELEHNTALTSAEIEMANAELIRAKDVVWSIRNDRVRTAEEVRLLAGSDPTISAIRGYLSIQQALSAIDRLEVRGRDSAGIGVFVSGHGLDVESGSVARVLAERGGDELHRSGSVQLVDNGALSFVYKAAAAIGELGDNTAAIRTAVFNDELLRLALQHEEAEAVIIGHTRWASVGIISEPNAHPLNSREKTGGSSSDVLGVLNGDVDNFADLIVANALKVPTEITTDAKVIPTLMARQLDDGLGGTEAFRCTVSELEGSVAIAAHAAADPERLLLALRGSGQALYVGLAEDCYIVASEPYGVVEETASYVRMDGETPGDPNNPAGSRGQILSLDKAAAGRVEGISRISYDGTELPVDHSDVETAQITTRDIDRGDAPHFLLKEIREAPLSFHKTLRGRLVEVGDGHRVALGDETLPPDLREALQNGSIKRISVIGQGTAAVAGQSVARAIGSAVAELPMVVESILATELSGFRLRSDMTDTLVVAVSQSGTTTDTNRTVDLVRSRGARVVSIVNRRGSDLTDKSDGVLYTSDGRDVEMSVASTKAFYSQVAAGFLLAEAIAVELGVDPDDPAHQEILTGLRDLPDAMRQTIELRPQIAEAAGQFAPANRYWAVVGNGMNHIAAAEVRIKLSELCYKSIACDHTEDKKHIDLSSEPMIFVCAAGLSGSTATDVAKEVAIYRAHKAKPIVVATEGDEHFSAALSVISVPSVPSQLAFVLSAMVGHLFGYEAALAIDAQAVPLRESRAVIEELVGRTPPPSADDVLMELRNRVGGPASQFFDGLRSGSYNGHLEASTAFQAAALYRYVLGITGLDGYQGEFGKVGTPSVVVEDFTRALTRAIEELTRPVDAIKHQAKTVTVGISRSDESLLELELVKNVIAAGASRDRLSYSTLKALGALDPAVVEVTGFTRYRIEPDTGDGDGRASVVDRGGVSLGITTRTEADPVLKGTKRRVARDRQVLVTRGARDQRTIILVPEVKDNETTGITLLHVQIADTLPAPVARSVMAGYRRIYEQLRDSVTETESVFREDLLATIPMTDLLTTPIASLAKRWRSQ